MFAWTWLWRNMHIKKSKMAGNLLIYDDLNQNISRTKWLWKRCKIVSYLIKKCFHVRQTKILFLLVKKYGEGKILAINKPRRLLLFLNPEANDGYVRYYSNVCIIPWKTKTSDFQDNKIDCSFIDCNLSQAYTLSE